MYRDGQGWNRSEFVTTKIDENAIAAAARIGLSCVRGIYHAMYIAD